MYFYAVNKKGVSCRKLLSIITLESENQISVFKQCQAILRSLFFAFFWGGGGDAQKPKLIHKVLRSVQFLASFISFDFEILSYLACEERIVRLASKMSVKSVREKSSSDF